MHVKLWRILPLLLLLLPLGYTQQANAAKTPRFSLSSAAAATPAGESKTIDIDMDGAVDLVAFELKLEYDPALWEFSSAGSELAGYKTTPLPEQRKDGIVTFVFAKIGRAAGENGSVHLGHVTLRALSPGHDRIRLTGVRLVDSTYSASTYTPNAKLEAEIRKSGGGGAKQPHSKS